MKSLTGFSLLVLCTVLLSTTHVFAQNGNLIVYDEALQSPWINNSWSASITFNSTEQALSGAHSIKAVASSWGALSLHYGSWGSEGIDPNPYQSLDLAIYATETSTFYIFFNNDQGQSFPSASQTVAAGNWAEVFIPMSQLNPNGQTIQRLSIQKSTSGTFYVDDLGLTGTSAGPPPATPTLATPANGDTVTIPYWNVVGLAWNASEGAATYRVQISSDTVFSAFFVDSDVSETEYMCSTEGQSPSVRYWRVSATNASGTSEWSEVRSFYFTWPPPQPPTLASPMNGTTEASPTSVELKWELPGGAEPISHHLQVSTDTTFSALVHDEENIHPSRNSTILEELSYGTSYYWRLRARGEGGATSDWSAVWSFTTESSPPPPTEGWVQQTSGTTQSLLAVSFVDQNVGTVVGTNGTILRTTDGGTTWTPQESGTSVDLNGVSFTDANTGTAVGGNYFQTPGIILRTTNGGTTWVEQSTEYGASALFGVFFIDANNGMTVGGAETAHWTTNGGITWAATFVNSGVELWGVSLTGVNAAFAVGGGSLGHIFRTTDGGVSWRHADSAYFGTASTYSGVSFSDVNNGFVVSIDGTIVHTTDGGDSFTFNKDVTSQVLYAVSSPISSHAFAVGNAGTILRTTDGGTTWATLSSGTSVQLRGVSFVDANTGTAVGENGTILRTTDGGGAVPLQAPKLISPEHQSLNVPTTPTFTWNPSSGATSYRLQVSENYGFNSIVVDQSNITDTSYTAGVLAANTGHAWRVMASNIAETSGWSAHSTFITGDAPPPPTSRGWLLQSSGTTNTLHAVDFISPNIAIAIGNNGTILRTTDKGVTWTQRPSGTTSDLIDIAFTNTTTGIAVGFQGVILKTTDGGVTWIQLQSGTNENFRAISFADSITAAILPYRGYGLHTTDGGTTWLQMTLPNREWMSIDFADNQNAVALENVIQVRSSIWHTTDAGATWDSRLIPPGRKVLVDVKFGNANIGTAVGTNGLIVTTKDAGVTWMMNTDITERSLYSVSQPSALFACAVGDSGFIFRTTDGGSTWLRLTSGTSNRLNGVSFFDAMTGIAVGDLGTILRTEDGGGLAPLQAPILISPEDGVVEIPTSPTFIWNASVGATSYRLQVSDDNRFNSIVLDQQGITDTLYTAGPLAADHGHAWRVMASNSGEISDWSAHRTFITVREPPQVPVLIAPTNGATDVSLSPTLSWNPTPGTFDYHVQVALDSVFGAPTINTSGISDTSYSINDLPRGTTFYWRVRARNNSGSGNWSNIWSFTTEITYYPDLIAYDDALQSPWVNASWSSTVTFGSTEQTYDGSASSIKVVANSWGALSLHHGSWGSQGIDPALYQSLDFAVYSTNATSFYISLGNDQGDSFPSVGKSVDPNSWVVVSIPMSQLNPSGLTFHRLSIQKSTSGTFYADALRLIGAPSPSASSDALAMETAKTTVEIPTEFGLSQNYPNPFNPVTNIRYELPEASTVTLKVYNLLGQEVATLVESQVPAGYHVAILSAEQLASGMYIYRIQALGESGTSFVRNQRMILLK